MHSNECLSSYMCVCIHKTVNVSMYKLLCAQAPNDSEKLSSKDAEQQEANASKEAAEEVDSSDEEV